MPLFLTIFLALYAAMNSYLFWKVHQAFPNLGRWHWVLAAVLLLLVASPILVRLVDRAEHPRLADAMGGTAYGWLAVLFWFCCVAGALDLWNLAAWGLSHPFRQAAVAMIPPRVTLVLSGLLVAGAAAWGLHEAKDIQLSAFTIRTPRLAPGSKPIRIVQMSDMHLGGGVGNGRLAKALKIIEEARPDLIVSTGDMVDSPAHNLLDYSQMLAKLSPPLGKWAIPGNHEYYVGIEEARKFHEVAGFHFLRGTAEQLPGGLWIACADDPSGRYDVKPPSDPLPVPGADANRSFVLLLKHRPLVQDDSPGRFDLQLSGHTHGGQIFPFSLIIAMVYKFDRGLYELAGGSKLYVSRGTGTWGPPMRLGSPPEVTLITIEPAGGGR